MRPFIRPCVWAVLNRPFYLPAFARRRGSILAPPARAICRDCQLASAHWEECITDAEGEGDPCFVLLFFCHDPLV